MPQNGLHGLVGLAVAKKVAPRVPAAVIEPFATAVTLGAMLPDVDLYPSAAVFLLGRPDLVHSVHRTLTHSVWFVLVLIGVGELIRARSTVACWTCRGLALGVLTHIGLDVFFWFSAIDLFWPLSHLPPGAPLLPVINLWSDVHLPPVLGNTNFIGNALGAVEFAAFALYLAALRRTTEAHRPNGVTGNLRRWEQGLWLSFALAGLGAVTLSAAQQRILVSTPYLVLFLPYCWGQTLLYRAGLAAWCCGGHRTAKEG